MCPNEITKLCPHCHTTFTTLNPTKIYCCESCGVCFRLKAKMEKMSDDERRTLLYTQNHRYITQRKQKKRDQYLALKQNHNCLRCGCDITHLHYKREYCIDCSNINSREYKKEYRKQQKEQKERVSQQNPRQ